MKTHKPLIERFEQKYVVDKETGCWLWTARIDDSGYGRFQRGRGVSPLAHRFAYEHFIGPVPDGMQLDHLCHTYSDCDGGLTCLHRRCVNPEHLELVTPRENTTRGRSFAAANGRKTHCDKGHELTPENTITRRDRPGTRACRTCAREYKRDYKRRQREAAAA